MWKAFFLHFAAAAAIVLLGGAALCAFVDPYDIYGAPRIAGLTATPYKSEMTERMTKPIQMNGRRIETLILGNSKADFALDPADWRALTGETAVYNAGIRDGRIGEMRALLAHAIDTHPELHRVLLAVDYESFRDDRRLPREFDEAQTSSGHITPANVARTLFSSDAIADSLITIRENRRYGDTQPIYSPNGCYSEDALARIFHQEDDFDKNLQGFLVAHREQVEKGTAVTVPYEELAAIRDLCAVHGIELRVVVPPVHPLHVAAFLRDRADYADWMARMAAVTPFVDATLAPGTIDDDDYWDTAHMKKTLGRRVLAALAGTEPCGVEVTPETADEHLAAQERVLGDWLAAHPGAQRELAIQADWTAELPAPLPQAPEPIVLADWTVHRDAPFRRSGQLPFRARDVRAIYAALETADGPRYYAARKSRDDDVFRMTLLADTRTEPCRYTVDAPAPPVDAPCRLLVVLHDGRAFLSEEMK